jgi:hypothetical protein
MCNVAVDGNYCLFADYRKHSVITFTKLSTYEHLLAECICFCITQPRAFNCDQVKQNHRKGSFNVPNLLFLLQASCHANLGFTDLN